MSLFMRDNFTGRARRAFPAFGVEGLDAAGIGGPDPFDAWPISVGATARALASTPSLRTLPLDELALQLRRSPLNVREGMAILACDLRERAGNRCSAAQMEMRISGETSFDDLMESFASSAAPPTFTARPGAGNLVRAGHHLGDAGTLYTGEDIYQVYGAGPNVGAFDQRPYDSPRARLWMMRPSVLATLLEVSPIMRRAPMVRAWITRSNAGLLARPSDVAGLEPRAEGGYAGKAPGPYGSSAPSSYQWVWRVVSGDNPSRIAKVITGNDRLYEAEMRANPSWPTVGKAPPPGGYSLGYNFKYFTAGDGLLIPREWNQYIHADGSGYTGGTPLPVMAAPTPLPPPDTTTGSEYTSTLPLGRISALKGELQIWNAKEYGGSLFGLLDMNDAIDETFLGAVRKFQKWSNAKKGTSLRSDGRLDAPTASAIDAYATGAATAPPPALPPPPVFGPPPKKYPTDGVVVEAKTTKSSDGALPILALVGAALTLAR